MNINLGLLETAHSIFREWRSRARSDAFWSIIKLMHSKFLVLYFQPFKMTIKLLATPEPLHAQTMAVLIDIYYDLTCQDLAPEFDDRHETFFAEGTGYFMQLMAWDSPQLQTDRRRRCLASARPEPLLARRTNTVLTVKGPCGRRRDRRGARAHLPLLFI